MLLYYASDDRWTLTSAVPKVWGVARGDLVNFIIEILPSGKKHLNRFLRYPEFGAFSDSDDLARIAFRLKWPQEGRWKSAYLQPTELFKVPREERLLWYLSHPESQYLTTVHSNMSRLKEALLNVNYTPERPQWMVKSVDLAIRQVVYNHRSNV